LVEVLKETTDLKIQEKRLKTSPKSKISKPKQRPKKNTKKSHNNEKRNTNKINILERRHHKFEDITTISSTHKKTQRR